MKSLFTIVSFTILGSILFSSCGSLTITKRRVNKGFYIATNRNKGFNKQVEESQAERPFNHKAQSEVALTPDEISPEDITPVKPEHISAPAQTASRPQATNTRANDVAAAQKTNASEPAANRHKTIRERIAALESTNRLVEKVAQPKKHLEKFQQKSSPKPIVGEVLSLFWIVILVIFLFYLVALLAGGFGLGGLIHLLLVITLILLILWLLGIV